MKPLRASFGRDVGVRWSEVELGYFVTCALAGVFDVGLDGEGVAGVKSRGGELHVGVGEGGVAEAVAESVERLALEVAVGAVRHRVVFEGGKLVEAGVEGDGETATGVVLAGEGFGDGLCAGLVRGTRLRGWRRRFAEPS